MILRSGQAGSTSFQVLTLALGLPDALELLDGERLDEVVLGVDDQGDPVVADEEPRPLDPLSLGLRLLVGLGRARGVDDVDLALKIAAEAAAGAVIVHDHVGLRIRPPRTPPAAALLIRYTVLDPSTTTVAAALLPFGPAALSVSFDPQPAKAKAARARPVTVPIPGIQNIKISSLLQHVGNTLAWSGTQQSTR